MRKIMIFLTSMVITICAFAQDIIVTTDAQKIEAKILEVTKNEIKYKELDNLDGPLFVLPIEDIVTIIYANGKVVLYNERQAAEDARKAKEAEALAKANQMGSLFGKTDNSTGSGNGKGVGQIYNPVDLGTPCGAWGLSGRSLRGTLPQPSNNFRQEGKVIVEIRVNAAGDVVKARVVGGTVNDKQTQNIALEAARKARFTEGEGEQIGTITYYFKFN